MSTLSPAQLLGIVQANMPGRSPDEQRVLVAIALAESGGRTDKVANEPDGTKSYGLWQINSIHKAVLASGDWSDPAGNARMAESVSRSRGGALTPWSTFKKGTYKAHLSQVPSGAGSVSVADAAKGLGVTGAVGAVGSGIVDQVKGAVTSPVTSVTDAIAGAMDRAGQGFKIAGAVYMAMALIGTGLAIVLRGPIMSAATSVGVKDIALKSAKNAVLGAAPKSGAGGGSKGAALKSGGGAS